MFHAKPTYVCTLQILMGESIDEFDKYLQLVNLLPAAMC